MNWEMHLGSCAEMRMAADEGSDGDVVQGVLGGKLLLLLGPLSPEPPSCGSYTDGRGPKFNFGEENVAQ